MEKEIREMLTDVNGKESAKRVWAGRYLVVGLAMAVVWFLAHLVLNIIQIPFSWTFPYEMWYGIVGFGAIALGVTIFESRVK